jgi:uncharacterized membrane protein (DUF2068 family)
MEASSRTTENGVGFRLIVAYKTLRGAAALALSIFLAGAATADGGQSIHAFAESLREHFMGPLGIRVAALLDRLASPRTVKIASAALGVDAIFTFFEAWVLHRRFRWAPWLVIIATASLLPFEIYEIWRSVHLGRVVIFVTNIAIVVYLVRKRSPAAAA